MAKGKKGKAPKFNGPSPAPSKKAKADPAKALDSDLLKPAWRFARVDEDWDRHGWKLATHEDRKEVYGRLKEIESRTWKWIKDNTKSHNVSVDQITGYARRRLRVLKHDDLDEIYSLRISGKKRVWGIRNDNALLILWWDPLHKVCPGTKG